MRKFGRIARAISVFCGFCGAVGGLQISTIDVWWSSLLGAFFLVWGLYYVYRFGLEYQDEEEGVKK